jgi:PAS domain S-box-containing protein
MADFNRTSWARISQLIWLMSWLAVTVIFSLFAKESRGGAWAMIPVGLMILLFVSGLLVSRRYQKVVETTVETDHAALEDMKRKLANLDVERERLELMAKEARDAESHSRQQTHRLWEVFYQLNHPAAFLDVIGNILDVNASAIELLGKKAEHLRGHKLTGIDAFGEGGEVFLEPLQRAAAGETVQFQVTTEDKGKGSHILTMSLKPVTNRGKVELLILEGHDITERVRAEEALQETFTQFQQSQKMEAIGRLAGGIAHDFNNLLTSILGFGNMAKEEVEEGSDVHADLHEVIQAAERAQNLTQKLLALSRKDVPASHPIDLNKLLMEMDNIIRVTLHENLEVNVELAPEPCIIQADPTSMEQVVLNLAVNARDSMPRSGRLFIGTDLLSYQEASSLHDGLENMDYVRLIIRDTGHGMDPEVLEHAFEPFFTTKESGRGTGLGLSTVYAIIKQFRGGIQVKSEPGEGTEFQIFLPRAERSEQMMLDLPADAKADVLPTGTETILLVEDEDAVRRMACKMIESLGYTLLVAPDGEEGVRVAENYDGKIDLIVTDVVMPNLSGPEMIDRLRLSIGNIPHLYVSGFTMDKLKEHGADGSEQILIRKPYSLATLSRRIRSALDGKILTV